METIDLRVAGPGDVAIVRVVAGEADVSWSQDESGDNHHATIELTEVAPSSFRGGVVTVGVSSFDLDAEGGEETTNLDWTVPNSTPALSVDGNGVVRCSFSGRLFVRNGVIRVRAVTVHAHVLLATSTSDCGCERVAAG